MSFTYTLTAEGSSDEMLIPLIEWVLARHTTQSFSGRYADPSVFDDRGRDVTTRVQQAIRYFPCDILFVHRDSDSVSGATRTNEVIEGCRNHVASFVPVVPVRMTEAWFLFDERAIRFAADRLRGVTPLQLPTPAEAARRADPKSLLEE